MSIAAEQWKAEARNEGRIEGRVEGRVEGLREGQVRTLLRQLERRFGQVSDTLRERVAAADLDSLDDVFDDGRSH